MNKCEEDILRHIQQSYKDVKYQEDNINAYSNIGLYRKRQEDSLLITRHGIDNEISLIAVADGMGGLENGSLASYIAVKELLFWFKKLKTDQVIKEEKIYENIENIIKNIDLKIRKKCGSGGTTLTFSLILKENTFFVNIGDSRR